MYGEEDESGSGREDELEADPRPSLPATTTSEVAAVPILSNRTLNSHQPEDNAPPHMMHGHGGLPRPDFDDNEPNPKKPQPVNMKRAMQTTAIERAGLIAGPSKVARTGGSAVEAVAPRDKINASKSMMLPPQLKGRSNVVTDDLTKYGLGKKKEGGKQAIGRMHEEGGERK